MTSSGTCLGWWACCLIDVETGLGELHVSELSSDHALTCTPPKSLALALRNWSSCGDVCFWCSILTFSMLLQFITCISFFEPGTMVGGKVFRVEGSRRVGLSGPAEGLWTTSCETLTLLVVRFSSRTTACSCSSSFKQEDDFTVITALLRHIPSSCWVKTGVGMMKCFSCWKGSGVLNTWTALDTERAMTKSCKVGPNLLTSAMLFQPSGWTQLSLDSFLKLSKMDVPAKMKGT